MSQVIPFTFGAPPLRDWGWALLIGVLAAASPHTSGARLWPSIAGGVVVSTVVLFVRRRAGPIWPDALAGVADDDREVEWAAVLPRAFCGLAAALVCMPGLIWLWHQYTTSIWRNGHGLFLPIILFCMTRSTLRGARFEIRSDPLLAAPFIVTAIFLSWLEVTTRLGFPGTLSVILMVPGLCLLLMGRAATRLIVLPLALLVFLIPIPEGLTDPFMLSSMTARLASPVIGLLGIHGIHDQVTYVIPGILFSVSAHCSGVAVAYAGVLLALLLGWRRPVVVRLVLLAVVWPATVLVNSLRLTLLVWGTSRFGMGFVESPIHGFSGIATFWAVMATITLVAFAMIRRTGEVEETG